MNTNTTTTSRAFAFGFTAAAAMSLFAAHASAADLTVGTPIDNIPGATISVLYPGDLSPDGTFFTRVKLTGVPSTQNEAIIRWDGTTANAYVIKGDLMGGLPIKSFGDPYVRFNPSEDGFIHIRFTAKLQQDGISTTAANDDVFGEWVSANGLFLRLREGDVAIPGYTVANFDWYHLAGSDTLGIQMLQVGTTTKKVGIWNFDSGVFAYVGGPVDVNGVTKTIKSIVKPAALAPMTYQTRMGNRQTLSVLIKTVEGDTLIKQFQP